MEVKTLSNYSYVQVIKVAFDEIEKIDFALGKQPTETPDSFYKRQTIPPDIVTNAGFFSMSNGQTCFAFADEGNTITNNGYDGVAIYDEKTLLYGYLRALPKCRDFMAAYPPLVLDGVEVTNPNRGKELDYRARRTAIGWDDNYFYIVLVDKPGLAFKALRKIFMDLKVKYAINLDGGGSTRALVKGKVITKESYARPVDNFLAIYLKKETAAAPQTEQKVIYRVQLGAFASILNAQKQLNTVREAGFPDAYVKKVGLLYKIQLGAFSVKLNAERMLDRVTAAGFKAFITTK